MSGRRIRYVIPAALVLSLAAASLAVAASQGPKHHKDATVFKTTLIGHNEVPAVHTKGQGSLTLTFKDNNTIDFELTYSNLNTQAQVAHVHVGQAGANGTVSFFFCGGTKPACPAGNTSTPVTVTGNVTAADVAAIPSQGFLTSGDIAGIEQEIREGFAYANVHTMSSGGGEIRGQLGGKPHGPGHGHGHGPHGDH